MDAVDVVVPVDHPRVEVEVALVVGVERFPQTEQVVDLIDRLAFGVQAVQLDVLQCPLDVLTLGFQFGGEVGLFATQR